MSYPSRIAGNILAKLGAEAVDPKKYYDEKGMQAKWGRARRRAEPERAPSLPWFRTLLHVRPKKGADTRDETRGVYTRLGMFATV